MRIFSDRNCAIQPIDALGLLRIIVHIVHEDSFNTCLCRRHCRRY